MDEFIAVAKTTDIPEGGAQAFSVAGREIAVFHHKGQFYALDDYCPHMGESLALGDIHGDAVLCSRHLWAFQLGDGTCVDVPRLAAETFEIRLDGDQILVRVPPAPEES
jgi:nitrite reductase (NADH) small subunit/3-phenylpropionate/trans-cinnamate dioxygenase ferredoxin subunit